MGRQANGSAAYNSESLVEKSTAGIESSLGNASLFGGRMFNARPRPAPYHDPVLDVCQAAQTSDIISIA